MPGCRRPRRHHRLRYYLAGVECYEGLERDNVIFEEGFFERAEAVAIADGRKDKEPLVVFGYFKLHSDAFVKPAGGGI